MTPDTDKKIFVKRSLIAHICTKYEDLYSLREIENISSKQLTGKMLEIGKNVEEGFHSKINWSKTSVTHTRQNFD